MRPLPKITVPFELAHPHDLLTRFFLVDIELMASLLKHYDGTGIVRLLDLELLRCESPTTIDKHLREVIGDLRFSTKFKTGGYSKVFFFFEHQSKKDNLFCIRCVRNLLEFYEQFGADPKNVAKNKGKYPYPLVVVLYHGKVPWDKLLQIGDLVAVPPGVDRHLLAFPVILIDLSRIQRENFKGHPALIALFDTLQSYSSGNLPESFDRIIGHFEEVKNDSRIHSWLNSITRYFLSVTKPDKEVAIETISKILDKKEAEKMFTSTMEELFVQGAKFGEKRGEKKGEKRGEKRGEIKRGARDVLRLLKIRFKRVPHSISRAVNSYSDPIALDSLLEYAATCKTLPEFERDLAHR
jgi:hypothetical protein